MGSQVRCRSGDGINALKKGMLFVYFHFKGMAKINTAENKISNIRRSCRRLCLICCNQKFAENVLSNIATVGPILLVKYEGSFSPTLLIFPWLH